MNQNNKPTQRNNLTSLSDFTSHHRPRHKRYHYEFPSIGREFQVN